MADVYALLVGIDEYPAPVPSLRGCVNDIEDARRYLVEAVPRADVQALINRQATRNAVIEGFRRHLSKAGPGDTALLWYSGHGSEIELPAHWWHLEPNGATMQTLVCVDSRGDGPPRDLLDKEIRLLIHEVAARGAHVVAVMDCCHSGGMTRALPPAAGVRQVGAPTMLPDLKALVAPELTGTDDSVSLNACGPHQRAHELPDPDGNHRGVFTRGLLAELRRPGPPRTYRELVAAARGYVGHLVPDQNPTVFPTDASIVDQTFLGGHVRPPATTMTMREVRGRWIVDAGSCHGLAAGSGTDMTRVAVWDAEPVREAVVRALLADHSVVEPIDWEPEAGRSYPVVLSHVPLPPTTVTVGRGAEDDQNLARAVEAAIGTAGIGGSPSPHLRLVGWADEHRLAELFVRTPRGGSPAVTTADGTWLAGAAPGQPDGGCREIVRHLEHIAQWRLIHQLRNPISRLANSVRIEVIMPEPYEHHTPRDRCGLRPGPDGSIDLEYRYGRQGFIAPSVFIRLDNVLDRPLHCVLLDLTDRFRIHASLFPGERLAPGSRVAAADGDLIEIALPVGRAVKPGAQVRDWLMLIVSEDEINSDHFALPRLGEPPVGREHRGLGLVGIVERLALSAQHRDADRRPAAARDWWTSVTEVVTRVPGGTEPARGR